MPTPTSSVGPLTLPIPPGATYSPVDDPTLTGLGAHFAFWLNYDLNTKLASLQTSREQPDGSIITTAVPTNNVFCWNPLKPNGFFTRGKGDGGAHPLPALYLWDDSDKGKPWSQLYGMRERAVKVAWIFEQQLFPDDLIDRFGLRAAACATLFRAVEQKYHPGFANVAIAVQLDLAGEGIIYQGSERGVLAPRVDTVPGSDQPKVRVYPTSIASLLVYEREDGPIATAADATPDLTVGQSVGDDPANPLLVRKTVIPAPPYPKDT